MQTALNRTVNKSSELDLDQGFSKWDTVKCLEKNSIKTLKF